MISLAPMGLVAAYCGGGRLVITSRQSVTGEVAATPGAIAVAFDDQVWSVEDGGRISRFALTGERIASHEVAGAGEVRYARRALGSQPGAVVGFAHRTVSASASGPSLTVVDYAVHPAQVVPARRMVQLVDGDAFVGERSTEGRANRAEHRVQHALPMLGGMYVALVGRDRAGAVVEVVSLQRDGWSMRVRAGEDPLVAATEQRALLVIVSERTLSVYDVVHRNAVLTRELAQSPVDLTIDARGTCILLDNGNAALEFIDLAASADAIDPVSAAEPPTAPAVVTAPRARGAYIDGRFVDGPGDGVIVSRSPAWTDTVLGTFSYADADVDAAVVAARAAAPDWAATNLYVRIAMIERFAAELEARSGDLAETMSRETGRPRWECWREVGGLSHRISLTIELARDLFTDVRATAEVRHIPWGVASIIGPAMLPLATSHQHLVAALVAGNTVVWKPSPLAAATAQLYCDALHGAGPPPGVVNVIPGPDEHGAALAAHPDVDCVVFTGSPDHAAAVRERWVASPRRHLILHTGSSNPAIVASDSMVALAAYEIATSAFISAGQRCTAVRRVYVERAILPELTAELIATCRSIRVGAPEEKVFHGPMLSEERLAAFEAKVAAVGAEPLLRGERLRRPGHFIRPALYLVEGGQALMPEIFGPALFVHPVDTIDAAINGANSGAHGLCAAVYAGKDRTWEYCARRVEAGSVVRNMGTHALSGRLPFGGVRGTGLGGRAGADALYSLTRAVSVQTRREPVLDIWPGTSPPSSAEPQAEHDGAEVN